MCYLTGKANIPPSGAPKRAPKNVPAERIDTTSDWVDDEMPYASGFEAVGIGLPNVWVQSLMAMIPLMMPVS